MLHLFLFLFFTFTHSFSQQFSLTLTDKNGVDQTVLMDESELKNFRLLNDVHEIPAFKDQWATTISPTFVSYEAFAKILQPLCKELKNFQNQSLSMSPEEIISSKSLYEDTKKVVQWLYQNMSHENERDFVDLIVKANTAASFLRVPFPLQRGFVNYLYDKGAADWIVRTGDLISNRAEWLISNRGFHTSILPVEDKQYRSFINLSSCEFRFFDAGSALLNVNPRMLTTLLICFDLRKNKIQNIDLKDLNQNVALKFASDYLPEGQKRPIFDFRENPLSDELKAALKQYPKPHDIKNFFEKFDEEIDHLKQYRQSLQDLTFKDLKSLRLKLLLVAFVAVGAGAFIAHFIISSIMLSKKFSIKNIGLSLLLSAGPGFYFARKDFLDMNKKIKKCLELIKQYEKELADLQTAKEYDQKTRIALVNDAFYILYND